MAFEGKCGPSVEGLQDSLKNVAEDVYDTLTERYLDDPSFQKSIGTNLPLYFDYGLPESLSGLQLDIDFGHLGNVRGICNHTASSNEFKIEWRIGPDFNEKTSFVSKHDVNVRGDGDEERILGLYVQDTDKTHCDWMQYITPMDKTALKFLQSVRAAPEGIKFVNWKQPPNTEEDSNEFENIIDEDKWYFTLRKLIDPRMAFMYDGEGYPTLSVLTLYLIYLQFHGDTSLPIMVTKENEQIFKLSDTMCRQVTFSSGGASTGYGTLTAFERITAKIMKDYPPIEARTDYNIWKGGYTYAQALMLVLSSNFEEAMWDYDMVDDPIRVDELVGNFLRVFGSYMNPAHAPSDVAREQLQRDLDFNDEHLRAGVFFFSAKNEQKELFSETVAGCLKEE
eukprot:scaffold1783_cov163-Skeletonema_menzelii.AAC.2